MQLTKYGQTEKTKFPIYCDSDIFETLEGIRQNICELEQDDDIDTDEEVLCAGIQ